MIEAGFCDGFSVLRKSDARIEHCTKYSDVVIQSGTDTPEMLTEI